MRLRSEIYTVVEVLKKTTRHFFKDLEVGDQIRVILNLDNVGGRKRSGVYATTFVVRKCCSGKSTHVTQTILIKSLDFFILEEYKETRNRVPCIVDF